MAHTLHNRALAIWKLCLSFRERDWELGDYPVETKEQSVEPAAQGKRWKPQRYMAFIVKAHAYDMGCSQQSYEGRPVLAHNAAQQRT
jgi:hypothetical protein